MKNIFRIFRSDVQALVRHFFAFVIIIAIAIIPALYAWFNIYANHDPYGSTGNISIAVASNDPGTTLDDGTYVNMSAEVLDELHESDSINWIFPDSVDAAIKGVYSGEYYAAIIISDDFSYNMYHLAAALSADAAPLTYYENAKKNAVANKITETAASTLQQTINTKYLQVLFRTVFEKANSVSAALSPEEAAQAAMDKITELRDTLDAYCAALGQFTANGDAVSGVLNDTQAALSSIAAPDTSKVSGAQATIANAQNAIAALAAGIDGKLDQMQASLDSLAATLDQLANSPAVGTITEAEKVLLDQALEQVQTLETQLQALRSLFPESGSITGSQYVIETLDALILRTQQMQETLSLLSRSGSLEGVRSTVASCSTTVATMQTMLTGSLLPGIDTMLSNFSSILTYVTPLLDSLTVTLDDVQPILGSAQDAVTVINGTLARLQSLLQTVSDRLTETLDKVANSTTDKRLETLIAVLGGDAQQYASFLSSPVDVSVETVYDVNSYGTAMTPFYSVLAIWVGGVMLVAILKVHADPKKTPGARDVELFFGRYLLFFLVGQLQALVIVLGDIYLLDCACVHPWLFWLSAAVTSFVFVTLIYSLTLSFGDVGKAIVVVIMVVQIAGSSGSYPIEILPDVFEKIYRFFPFPYAINAMREAICGIYQYDYLIYLGELLIFAVLAFLIGLVVRRPFIGVNRFVSEKLEETELM